MNVVRTRLGARAEASRRRARNLRRCPPRPPPGDRGGAGGWADAHGRHLRPPSASRARLRGRAALHAGAASRALRRPRRRGHARRRVHPRHAADRGGGLRRAVPARDRRRARWSPARTSGSVTSGEAISTCCAVSASTCDRCRCSRACPRRPYATCSTRAASTRPPRCWAGHPRWTGRWSRATRAGARSAFPPRTSPPTPCCSCLCTASTPGSRQVPKYRAESSGLDRDEPALRRRRAADRGLPARLRRRSLRQAPGRRAVAAPPRRGGVRQRAGADRPDRP